MSTKHEKKLRLSHGLKISAIFMLHEWKVVTRVQSCNTEEPYLKNHIEDSYLHICNFFMYIITREKNDGYLNLCQ